MRYSYRQWPRHMAPKVESTSSIDACQDARREHWTHEAKERGIRGVPNQILERLVAVSVAQASVQCTADLCKACLERVWSQGFAWLS